MKLPTRTPSKLLSTALAVLSAYDDWTIESILAPRTTNCTQRVYPTRLNRPALNNTAYATYFSGILPYFKGFHLTVVDSYIDEAANGVTIQAKSNASTPLGIYNNEYVIMMKMNECQDKVWEIKEFVDSEYSAGFFPNLTAYIAGGGKGMYEDE